MGDKTSTSESGDDEGNQPTADTGSLDSREERRERLKGKGEVDGAVDKQKVAGGKVRRRKAINTWNKEKEAEASTSGGYPPVAESEACSADNCIPQPLPCHSIPMLTVRYLSLAAILVAWLLMTSLEAKIRAVMVAFTFSCIEFHFRAITRKSAGELERSGTPTTQPLSKSEQDMRRAMGLPASGVPSYDSTSSRSSTWPLSFDCLRKECRINWCYWVVGGVIRRVRWRLSPSHILANGHTTWEQFWANVFYGPIMNDFYRDYLFAIIVPSFLGWHPAAQGLIRAVCFPLNIWVRQAGILTAGD
jgi:hypothetical protein